MFEKFIQDPGSLETKYYDLALKMIGRKYVVGGFLINSNHWISIVACKDEGTIYITDPFSSSTPTSEKIFKKIEALLAFFNHGVIFHWNITAVSSLTSTTQTDGVNCGIYVIEMQEQVLKQIKELQNLNRPFRPPQLININQRHMRTGLYRWKIAEIIMHRNMRKDKSEVCAWTHNVSFLETPAAKKKDQSRKGRK